MNSAISVSRRARSPKPSSAALASSSSSRAKRFASATGMRLVYVGFSAARSLPAVLPRVALLVEDVVHALEGEADALRVTVEALELGLRELLAAMRAEQDRSADERPGLEDMHVLELGEREVA